MSSVLARRSRPADRGCAKAMWTRLPALVGQDARAHLRRSRERNTMAESSSVSAARRACCAGRRAEQDARGVRALSNPPAALPSDGRGRHLERLHARALLLDSAGKPDLKLVGALDRNERASSLKRPQHKIDEELKRSRRFDQPLACVMIGFGGKSRACLARAVRHLPDRARHGHLGASEKRVNVLLADTPKEGAAIWRGASRDSSTPDSSISSAQSS